MAKKALEQANAPVMDADLLAKKEAAAQAAFVSLPAYPLQCATPTPSNKRTFRGHSDTCLPYPTELKRDIQALPDCVYMLSLAW